jgi:hypothetical protein
VVGVVLQGGLEAVNGFAVDVIGFLIGAGVVFLEIAAASGFFGLAFLGMWYKRSYDIP